MSSTRRLQNRFIPRQGRLRTQLLIVFLVLILLPIAGLIAISNITHLTRERAKAITQLDTMADIQTAVLEKWASERQTELLKIRDNPSLSPMIEQLTTLPPDADPTTKAEVQRAFTERISALATPYLASVQGLYDRVFLVDLDGVLLGGNDPVFNLANPDLSGEPWLQAALQNPDTVVTVGPIADPYEKDVPSLYFAVAVQPEGSSSPTGVLCGRVTLSNLLVILLDLPQTETSYYYLVEEGRRYVMPPPQAAGDLAKEEIVATALSGQDGSGEWVDYRGQHVYGVYRWIAPLHMSLIVATNTGTVLGEVESILGSQLILGAIIALLAIILAVFFARRIISPVERLYAVAMQAAGGEMDIEAPLTDALEFSRLADAFNRMLGRTRSMLEKHQKTITERNQQLEITSQISRVLATETDLDRLLTATINTIRDRLDYYHVQIFMTDDLHQYAVLRASTGAVGRELLSRGHKLQVGSQSVIGQATMHGDPILVLDTEDSPIHRRNDLLPDTRAELAVPLRVGDEIIGALDIQSVHPDSFDDETIVAFKTIADQLASAFRNVHLFQEKESLLAASLQLTQALTRESWDSYVSRRKQSPEIVGFKYDLSDVRPLSPVDDEDGGRGQRVNMPIALRGEVIGELATRLQPGQVISEDDRLLVGQVLDRVALAIENARLFEQTQASLMESNRLYEASQQIAAADSIPNLTNVLLGAMRGSTIDRAMVVLVDESGMTEGGRWLQLLGRWSGDPNDQVMALPERMLVEQFPLLLEYDLDEIGSGLVVNNTETAILEDHVRDTLRRFNVKSMAQFPVITGGRILGWLLLHSQHNTNVFAESDQRFFEAIADQAATALEGLRLFSESQVRVRRLQAVNEVSHAASSILNPDILLPLTVDKISEVFGYYHAQIFLIDDTNEWAMLHASTGDIGQELLQREHRLAVGSQSVIGQVTAQGEPVIIHDTDTDPIHQRNELLPNTRAEMAVPLRTGDRIIGALDVQSTQVKAFDTEAQVILQSLADQISVTLENAQLFREIQDRVAELTTVNLISQAVSRAETLSDLYDVVATQLQHTFGAQHGFLAVSAEKDMIQLPIFMENGQRIPPIGAIPIGQGLTNYVLKTREVLLINENVQENAQKLDAQISGTIPKSLLAVPLLLGDEIIGVISIQDPDREFAYNETHVRQLTTLAAYISVKIRNAELLDEAQRRASELGFLFNITRAAVATTELDEALSNVTNILLTEIPGAEAAIIHLVSPDDNTLEPHAAVGFGRDIAVRYPRIKLGETVIGMVAEDGIPLVTPNTQTDPRYGEFDDRIQAALIVPLRAGAESIGVLMLASSEVNVFGDRELRLLEAASSTLTAIIQNARLLDQITRANDQLRELDKLKGQFLANMSHELRTPLNSIIGFSRVMLKGIDGPLSDLQSQDLNTIYQSGQHLLGLINDILDISKIEAGKMEIQPDYISLPEIVDGVMATGQGLISDKPIQIFKEIEADLPNVYGDPVRVRGVLLNLVANAAKFTHEGSITIRASHKDYDPETGEPSRVQVDVVDTGIGISQEDIGKLFQAFSQVDGSTTRQVGGTGLGLAISRQFIEMHGGRMWVESEKGVGSIFSFTVPLHAQQQESSDIVFLPKNDDGRPVVLAVDDEPGVLDLYSRYLEKQGYAIVGLSNAGDLLNRVREFQPVAILLDLNMPNVDGWVAIDQLKQAEDTRDIPIVICSIEDARQRANNVGVTEYLVKPIIEEDLLEALNRALGGMVEKALSVLILDGNEQYARTMQETLLLTQRYNANVVGLGHEGLQTLHEQKPDILIVDLDLPDMDGYGLLASLRTQEQTRNLPILIVSSRELPGDAMERLGESLTAYLNKNEATPEQLLAALATTWEKVPK
ncbi:MAG: GAF domain-containing protein [Anaerolineae bacterium]|nr:GAF domain-containing protein [Anaerolineae bacterium]